MNVTLAFIAGVVFLLPGLAALLAWNAVTARSAASRPELTLSAVSTVTVATLVSVVAHVVGMEVSSLVTDAAREIFVQSKGSMSAGFGGREPFGAVLKWTQGRIPDFDELMLFALAVLLECVAVANIVTSPVIDVLLMTRDFANRGWAYRYIVQPAMFGYRPIGYVLTLPDTAGLGLGYRGTVVDLRQDERGDIVSVVLAEPERYLYELSPRSRSNWTQRTEREPDVVMTKAEQLGGVVFIAASAIRNIVVHSVSRETIERIEPENATAL